MFFFVTINVFSIQIYNLINDAILLVKLLFVVLYTHIQ